MHGITFNGKHSHDMGYTIPADGRDIGFPSKEKIIVKVPFSNVEYDFSESYGSQPYTSRNLTYSFNVFKKGVYTPEALQIEKTRLINWLMHSHGKQKLYDDTIPGYYFLAEVENEAAFQDDWETGTLTVTFRAYPFMIAELTEGNDIWDTFNFDLDTVLDAEFRVDGTLRVILLNVGTPDVIPEIIASSDMYITRDDVTYPVPQGVSKDKNFMLNSGENELIFTGEGSIAFRFYKELI